MSEPTVLHSRCPICKRPAILKFRPFCSKRCADIDLAKWLSEEYRVPGDENDENSENEGSREG